MRFATKRSFQLLGWSDFGSKVSASRSVLHLLLPYSGAIENCELSRITPHFVHAETNKI